MQDMNQTKEVKERLPVEMIMDGQLLKENINLNDVSEVQLLKQLKSNKNRLAMCFMLL